MRLAVIHYHALEGYPPVMNFLGVAATDEAPTAGINSEPIRVFTTHNPTPNIPPYEIPNTKIQRYTGVGRKDSLPIKIWKYGVFNVSVLLALIRLRPTTVVYYETISSWAAIIYQQYFNSSCRVAAHYHEYVTTGEYERGSAVVRWLWRRERAYFSRLNIVSHTNQKRMSLFEADYPSVVFRQKLILPNYPPASWSRRAVRSPKTGDMTRFVYVGALSYEGMYLEEVVRWVIANETTTLDIYTTNITPDAKAFLSAHPHPRITLKGGVPYEALPTILATYDVGLILYKGLILNYVHNAPNKLFEYLACGLHVWYPAVMEGCDEYAQTTASPFVQAIDYEPTTYATALDTALRTIRTANKPLATTNATPYSAEAVYRVWLEALSAKA